MLSWLSWCLYRLSCGLVYIKVIYSYQILFVTLSPTELIWAFLFHKFSNFTPKFSFVSLPPPPSCVLHVRWSWRPPPLKAHLQTSHYRWGHSGWALGLIVELHFRFRNTCKISIFIEDLSRIQSFFGIESEALLERLFLTEQEKRKSFLRIQGKYIGIT